MKILSKIFFCIIVFLKLKHSFQCTWPEHWLEVADSNPIDDLKLTFIDGNKRAILSFKENNEAGVILTLLYNGRREMRYFSFLDIGECSAGKCDLSVLTMDRENYPWPFHGVWFSCQGDDFRYVDLDLQDVNDNEPFFESSPSRMNCPENFTGVIRGDHVILGSDLDNTYYSNLVGSVLINGIESQNFRMIPIPVGDREHEGVPSSLNRKPFQTEVFKALDFEEQTTYVLELVLSDGLLSASTFVPLFVDDRPDQPPQWSKFHCIISIPEDTHIGHVIAIFIARDGDLGIDQPIRYELRGGKENIELDPQTGNLTLVKQIDRDVNGAESFIWEFEIFAIENDNSSEGITGSVLMNVTDINDNIPRFNYPGPYNTSVPEGTVGNIIFDHFIEVTDMDFGINGSYSAEIIIENLNVTSGKLQIVNPITGTAKGSQVTSYSIICNDTNFLDYEFKTEINFKVKVTEDADISHFSEADFTITLEEVKDHVDVHDDKQLYMVLFYVTATILVIIVVAMNTMYIMRVKRHKKEVRALQTAQLGFQDSWLNRAGSKRPSADELVEGVNSVSNIEEERVQPENTNNDGQRFGTCVSHSTSPVPETAGQLSGASGSKTNCIDSSLPAKVKNQSQIGLPYENRLKNGVRLTISTLNDEKFLGIGANKLGITVEAEANQ